MTASRVSERLRDALVRVPPQQLPPSVTTAVLDAARQTWRADGPPPLNDDESIALEQPDSVAGDTVVTHLPEVAPDGAVHGYAQLQQVAGHSTGTVFVVPEQRSRGLGRALLDAVLDATPAPDPISLWAPGDHPAARRLAERTGLHPERTLLIMSRELEDTVPKPQPAPPIALRTFRRGVDEPGFLSVNARAFAHHPEQGRLERRGFEAKAAEPWFDADGFFLAVDPHQRESSSPGHTSDGRIVGFHWTKVRAEPDGPVGEVYVIGVDPDAEGHGLAKALLSRGLQYLRSRGCRRVILYVEGDHERAVGLYRRYGFDVSRRDVMYAR